MGGSDDGAAECISRQKPGGMNCAALLLALTAACSSPDPFNPSDAFQSEYWKTEMVKCLLSNDCGEKRVSTPVFSPAGSTYTTTQSVTVSVQPSGSTVCYVAGGETPVCSETKSGCTLGNVFHSAIAVAAPLNLRAVGCRARYTDSSVAQASFVVDSTPPTVPGATLATPISTTSIDLTWSQSSDDITPAEAIVYEVCRSTTAGGCNTFTLTDVAGTGVLLFSSTGLAPTTTYYYRIRARDNASLTSASSVEFSATTQAAGSVNSPTFSPTGGSYNAPQTVTISTTSAGAIICFTTNGAAPLCDAPKTGCTTGTLYATAPNVAVSGTLKAVACSAGFTDSNINSASFVVDTIPPSTPSAPAATAGIGQIALSWTGSTDDQTAGPSIVYQICQSTTPTGCNTFTTTYTTAPGAAGYTATSLSPLSTYYFRIRARDSVGNVSTPSAQVSATVLL